MANLILVPRPAPAGAIALGRPVREAVICWNGRAARGNVDVVVSFEDGRTSRALRYASWTETARSSGNERDGDVEIAIDVVRATAPFVALDVRSTAHFDRIWIATPPPDDARRDPLDPAPLELHLPAYSQYLADRPDDGGLCSPASLAMILAYWGSAYGVASVADAVRADAFGGAGNWAFNAAFAGSLGFAASAAYLRGLAQARRFLAAGIPIAASIAWKEGALPGAPLPSSVGHFVVVRGFADGNVLVNDPALPQVRAAYPAEAFERAWLGHGGVVYAIAPRPRAGELADLANGAGRSAA
jgi:hypothetical protein